MLWEILRKKERVRTVGGGRTGRHKETNSKRVGVVDKKRAGERERVQDEEEKRLWETESGGIEEKEREDNGREEKTERVGKLSKEWIEKCRVGN